MLAHLVVAPGSDDGGPRLWTDEPRGGGRHRVPGRGVRRRGSIDRTPAGRRPHVGRGADAAPSRDLAAPPRHRRPRCERGGCRAAVFRLPRDQLARFLNRALGVAAAVWRPQRRRARPAWWSALRSRGPGARPAAPAAALRRRRVGRADGGGRRRGHLGGARAGASTSAAAPDRPGPARSGCSATRPSWAPSWPTPARVADRPRARAGAGRLRARRRRVRGRRTAHGERTLEPEPRPGRRRRGEAARRRRPATVLWDEIVAIDDEGDEQVYDLTVPGTHNFVAADVFVHNTSFALGMAAHAALHANQPVLLFSLEMGSLELSQRLLCGEARIDSRPGAHRPAQRRRLEPHQPGHRPPGRRAHLDRRQPQPHGHGDPGQGPAAARARSATSAWSSSTTSSS